MMIMRPPQQGQGRGSTRGSSAGCGFGVSGCFATGRHGEQLACPRDVGGAIAVGKQPVVADAVEALGQHVHEEAPDELVGGSVIVL